MIVVPALVLAVLAILAIRPGGVNIGEPIDTRSHDVSVYEGREREVTRVLDPRTNPGDKKPS